MKGFKDFIMRGNLIELAVAFIIGGAFATLAQAMVKVILELLSKAGGAPSFDAWHPFGMSSIGPFLTALVAFLLLAFVVYFAIVKPYETLKARMRREEPEVAATEVEVLTEIRDLLATQRR